MRKITDITLVGILCIMVGMWGLLAVVYELEWYLILIGGVLIALAGIGGYCRRC